MLLPRWNVEGKMKTDLYYHLEVAGLERELPVFRIDEVTAIAAFIIFGDVELTVACAAELAKRMPAHDIMITAEAKIIPLLHELARQQGENTYIVARKGKKVYMDDPVAETSVHSITTQREQHLYLGHEDMEKMRGKRVVIVDDVISTGESLWAMEDLVSKAGGVIVGKMGILAEGDAIGREDIDYLAELPLLDGQGKPKA